MTNYPDSLDVSSSISAAAARLKAGGLVAFPTETVYGLGADAANEDAARRIFAVKGRPADHPLIVHLARAEDLSDWAREIPEAAYRLAALFWPGPLTLILKKQPWVSEVITGGQESIGLRVPAHPVALALLRAFAHLPRVKKGAGIAAPSANRFGRISPTTAAHVREELGGAVDEILEDTDDPICRIGIESTILDLTRLTTAGAVILRPGGVTPQMLAAALGSPPCWETARSQKEEANTSAAPRVSGALPSHYAPNTPLRLQDRETLRQTLIAARQLGLRCGALLLNALGDEALHRFHVTRALSAHPESYARALYAALRELDCANCAELLAETPPDQPEWAAVRDRLFRAAAK